MAKKTMCFDLNSSSIKIKELMQTKDFIMIELWAISDEYPNNNTSHFPYNTMQTNVDNKVFYNKPILGKFNNATLNYEVHNSQNKYDPEYDIEYKDYENGERPLGVIRESDNVRIETDNNGLHWIVFTAVLWVKYNYQGVKRILKSKTSKVSVEVTVFESHEDENGIEVFDKWMFDGVTILGYRPNTTILAKEGINNAHLTILEKMGRSEFSHQIKSLQFAYDEFDKNNDIKENDSHLYIEENKKKEGMQLFTYEQKRDLLQEKLSTFLNENEWGYVCDLDDSNVFFRVGDVTYRTEYTLTDEGECSFDYDSKTRVIHTWKDFEDEELEKQEFEDNKDDSIDNKEEEESCKKEQKCEKDSEDKPEEKTELEDDKDDSDDKDDDSNDEDDSSEHKEESTLNGELFNKDEKKEDPEDNSNGDCKECSESGSDDNTKECSKDDEDVKEDDKEHCGGIKMESEQKFVVNDVEYTAQEIFEKYTESIQNYSNLDQKYKDLEQNFESVQEKCNQYESDLKKINNETMSLKMQEIVKEKTNFSEEEVNSFVDRCKNGEFASIEEATKEIAYLAFMKNDNADNDIKSEKQTEFSAKADIHFEKKVEKQNKKNKPIDGLKDYVSK